MTPRPPSASFTPASDTLRLVWPLSAAQLVSWGTIYYSFTLFLEPMERDLGLARTELTGALTLGLLVAGLCSLPVGALIDRGHARLLMTGASLFGGLLLLAWSGVETTAPFFAIWIGLGLVLSATLYEPAFAVLVRALGERGQRGVATMTLIGGFASTLFIPLTHLLIETLDWRGALVALALLNLALSAPIHAISLRGDARRPAVEPTGESGRAPIASALRRPTFWWLSLAFTAGFFAVSAVVFHVVPLLAERGYAVALAVSAIALFGPAQVAGRVVVTLVVPGIGLLAAGCTALGLPALGFLLVLLGPQSFWTIALFAIALGAGNGIMTIVRAQAVAELIGRAGFGAVNGALNAPISAARALAPSAAAAIWAATGGYTPVLWALAGLSVVALLAFVAGVAAGRKGRAG